MTTVTLSKKEQIAAAKQAFVTGGLVQVQGVAPLEVFVKQLNSAEFRSIKATAESFKGKYDDGLNDERELSLELFDADGQLYFDHTDVAEMQFLAQHLNADAQVIVSLPNVGHHAVLNTLLNGDWPYASAGILDVTHIRFFTEKTMLELFAQTGFQVMEKQYLIYQPVQTIESFPVQVNFGSWQLEVRDEAHWFALNSIQLGFRLKKSS